MVPCVTVHTHKGKKEFQKSVFVFYCLISKMVVYLNLYITDSCTPYQSTRREKVMFKFKKGCDFPSRSLSIASNSSTVGGIFILDTTRSMEIKCIKV